MPNVPPLQYSQVRMLAEAALGTPNATSNTFWFNPNVGDGPVLVPPGSNPQQEGVIVPTSNYTIISPLATVTLEPDTPTTPVGVDAVSLNADAAFWTNSAVQKFVFPYYASVMGYEAAQRLGQLQAAWNGEVPGVQVYALLHVTAAPDSGGEPVPVEPLMVAFVEQVQGQARAAAMSLSNFIERYRPGPATELLTPDPQPYTLPGTAVLGQPGPTYGALRSMAEWSACIDAPDLKYFRYDPDTNTFGRPLDTPGNGDALEIPVQNTNGRALPLARVMVGLPGQTPVDLYEAMSYWRNEPVDVRRYYVPDSFFWSTGAIEQFLLPYYASIDGFLGLPNLLALQDAWQLNFKGTGGEFQGSGSGSVMGPEGGEELLGLVHIPRSLWVTEESASVGESAFLHMGAEGKPRVTLAREFIAKTRRSR
jgi:hypothetical protein